MTGNPNVALGERRYRIDRAWMAPGRGDGVAGVAALAVGADGLLYALRREAPYVVVFDLDGRLVRRLDAVAAADGHGIFAAPDGSLWLAARDEHSLVRIDPAGRELQRIGAPDRPAPHGPFGHLTRGVVAPDGELYVTDGYADAVVHRYTADGTLLSSWGRGGIGDGEFRTPHSLWVTATRVYVLDRDNDRIQVFDRAGELQDIWTDFLRPMDVWMSPDEELFVTEQVPRLSRWSADGRLLGRCRLPHIPSHSIAGDDEGRLYVVELVHGTIARLVPEAG